MVKTASRGSCDPGRVFGDGYLGEGMNAAKKQEDLYQQMTLDISKDSSQQEL